KPERESTARGSGSRMSSRFWTRLLGNASGSLPPTLSFPLLRQLQPYRIAPRRCPTLGPFEPHLCVISNQVRIKGEKAVKIFASGLVVGHFNASDVKHRRECPIRNGRGGLDHDLESAPVLFPLRAHVTDLGFFILQ